MAGYICKIVIEDTHPPVWRRVIVPDRITFFELHQIIQTVFQWERFHLHDFRIPSDNIVIEDQEGFDTWEDSFKEKETNIDQFFQYYKWIRYTYDFGDDWRHRINIEKRDPDYNERTAKLLKYKGDNFMEDSGGIYCGENHRFPFDKTLVEKQLENMSFPEHEQEVIMLQNDPMKEQSLINIKVEDWIDYQEIGQNSKIKLVKSYKTQKELLENLGPIQSADYCKYLGIPDTKFQSHKDRINLISDTLKRHPEYILYVLSETEYDILKKWIDNPTDKVIDLGDDKYSLIRPLVTGLLDFQITENVTEVSLASNIEDYIGVLDVKTKSKIYRQLRMFDTRVGKLMQVYCLIEIEELYRIYKKLYKKDQNKEEFFRYIYWHARMSDNIKTFYGIDGTAYAAMEGIEIQEILPKRDVYAEDLPFQEFSTQKLDQLTGNLIDRSPIFSILFMTLRDWLSDQEAADCLIEVFGEIMNGVPLDIIIENIKSLSSQEWVLDIYAEMWSMISHLMMELEIPMLKARNRTQYAGEQRVSRWSIGMLSGKTQFENTKNQHFYEFPPEVQECMYDAERTGMRGNIDSLLTYKRENKICSEEFIYILSTICVKHGYLDDAEDLIKELRKSSPAGKDAARFLKEAIEDARMEDDWFEDQLDFIDQNLEKKNQPYIKTEPKVGRNDPCPCGSGKKYKKCCGRNL